MKRTEGEPVKIVVLVDEALLNRIDEVVTRLQATGLEVAEVRRLGVVTGLSARGRIDAIRQADGVFRVEVLEDAPNIDDR